MKMNILFSSMWYTYVFVHVCLYIGTHVLRVGAHAHVWEYTWREF